MTVPVSCYYLLRVEASTERLPHIRSIISAHLRHWTLSRHIEPVSRGVRELVLNVIEHAGDDKECAIELWWNGRYLTASVADRAERLPCPLGPEQGGLAMVAAVSDTWGACGRPDGKIVWFTRRAQSAERLPLQWPLPAPDLRAARSAPLQLIG